MRRSALGRADPRQVPLLSPDFVPSEEVTETSLVDGELRTATLSACGTWRYRLTRRWGDGPELAWVLQNPSKADGREDDQTVRRGRSFTRAAGFSAFSFVNLWALRETDSAAFFEVLRLDPARAAGPGNAAHLLAAGVLSAYVVCAWGGNCGILAEARLAELIASGTLRPGRLRSLGSTRSGAPLHPSRLPNGPVPEPWDPFSGYLMPF